MKKIFLPILLLMTFILAGCVTQSAIDKESHAEASPAQVVDGDLKISMLNIGHGDAILIQTKKQTILIDSALPKKHRALINGLKKFSITKIDKLILTHPHGDHIGGAKMLISPNKEELKEYPYLEKISVAEVYDNGVASASKLYKGYINAAQTKGLTLRSLKAGDTLDFGDGVKFKVISPTAEFVKIANTMNSGKPPKKYSINNGSIVGKLTYKNFSMMFTGDCAKESEARILANNNAKDLKCNILKSGHHGIGNASTKNFVKAINPNYVLISAANSQKNNIPTGFPSLAPLQNYLAAGVNKNHIFCTRWNGTITVVSDGKNFSVTPEKKEDWVDKWIAQKKKEAKK